MNYDALALDEIQRLRQQLADKHQLFMCASANYDRLAEHIVFANDQLSECEAKWNMTADALVMATGQIGELVAALEQVKHYAESQRVWNGTGWSYRYPFERIHDTATAALAKVGADKTGEA